MLLTRLSVSPTRFISNTGAYCTRYLDGRRPIYVCGLPVFCIASLGVATAQNVLQVMIWRFVQAFGAGSLSVGAAAIGDIYQLEERGFALGIFFGVSSPFGTCRAMCTNYDVSQLYRSVFWVLHSRLLLEVLRTRRMPLLRFTTLFRLGSALLFMAAYAIRPGFLRTHCFHPRCIYTSRDEPSKV